MLFKIDGLEQERRNSIANALELHLSCINPSNGVYFVQFLCVMYSIVYSTSPDLVISIQTITSF